MIRRHWRGNCLSTPGALARNCFCSAILHRLTGPIRPTGELLRTSPRSGLYPKPLPSPESFGTPPLVPRFRRSSMQTCNPLRPRAFVSRFQSSDDNVAFVMLGLTRHGQYPTIRFRWGLISGLSRFAIATACLLARLPWRITRGHPRVRRLLHPCLSTRRSPGPTMGMTTSVSGHLRWRDCPARRATERRCTLTTQANRHSRSTM